MSREPAIWSDPASYLAAMSPDAAVLFMSPQVLQTTARQFLHGFPGLVTYAVKANSTREVLENLVAAGLTAFDVASPAEMRAVREVSPSAVLHYNNPVRSMSEIDTAMRFGVRSYSVDCSGELDKLIAAGLRDAEISVRLRLPVPGAAYDFGAKFGADPAAATDLLRRVKASGLTASMTFHPGTQCEDPSAWRAYIETCADVARMADVSLRRLNVGGGFPSHRQGAAPRLAMFFTEIAQAVADAFGPDAPDLVCEPGRAMVAEAFTLGARVKSLRPGAVYLNDGIYGGLAEFPVLGPTDRIEVVRNGSRISGPTQDVVVFGPTCDSLDRLPGTTALPKRLKEDDYILFHGLGAYSTATVTRFNGYGALEIVNTRRLG